VELQKEVYRHLKHGGIFITSGIIDTAEEKVRKAIGENPEWKSGDKPSGRMGEYHSKEKVSVSFFCKRGTDLAGNGSHHRTGCESY
jgi:hypothetical protein